MPPIEIPPALSKLWGVTGTQRDKPTRYRVLRAFCIGHAVDVSIGEEVTLPEHVGRTFVAAGKLAKVPEPPAAPPSKPASDSADSSLDNADPTLANADPDLDSREPGKASKPGKATAGK